MSVTVNPSKDAYISSADKNTNFGSNGVGFIDNTYSGGAKQYAYFQLVQFDLSGTGLSANQVNNARLVMVEDTNNASGAPMRVITERCTRTDWVEAEVTWNNYKASTAWTTAGGDVTTVDASVTDIYINYSIGNTFYFIDLAALVKDAISNRSNQLSLRLRVEDTATTEYLEWQSKESSGSGDWYLEINYQTNQNGKSIKIEQARKRSNLY